MTTTLTSYLEMDLCQGVQYGNFINSSTVTTNLESNPLTYDRHVMKSMYIEALGWKRIGIATLDNCGKVLIKHIHYEI